MPRPCANSCSATVTRSTLDPWWSSSPRYQPVVPKQVPLPRSLLKTAEMSALAGSRSVPANLLARAIGYQTSDIGALAKFATTFFGPVWASTALEASQVSDPIFTSMTISTLLSIRRRQMSAAYCRAIIRCCPSVVGAVAANGLGGSGVIQAHVHRVDTAHGDLRVGECTRREERADRGGEAPHFFSVFVLAPLRNARAASSLSTHAVSIVPSVLRRTISVSTFGAGAMIIARGGGDGFACASARARTSAAPGIGSPEFSDRRGVREAVPSEDSAAAFRPIRMPRG